MGYEAHTILDGKVHVCRRENSCFWQCAVYLGGRNHRQSTKEASLAEAKVFAQGWYLERYVDERRRRRRGEPAQTASRSPEPQTDAEPADTYVGTDPRRAAPRRRTPNVFRESRVPSFREATDAFLHECEIMTQGERNPKYVQQKHDHIRVHLLPLFGDRPVTSITSGPVQDYRIHRRPRAAIRKRTCRCARRARPSTARSSR